MFCEECNAENPATVEETFDYAGTHCNHGRAGTHHTGHYISACCGAELVEYPTSCCGVQMTAWEESDLCPICLEHTGVS